MYHCQFSTEDLDTIRHQRYHHPDPLIRKRMTILWHKHHGEPHHRIAILSGASSKTVTGTICTYIEKGLASVQERKFHHPKSQLDPYRAQLIMHFSDHPPRTLKAAGAEIERLTGLSFTIRHVANFLNSIGMRRRKTGSVPGKLDDDKREEQKAFISNNLEPALEDAKQGHKHVYFVDAAHFVLATFLGFLWCFHRRFVYSASGRQRFNVLGALNAITHEVVTVTNDTYINAASVCELLRVLAQKHAGEEVVLFLDNARYQKCAIVFALAKDLGITLIYLPSYSPNLNLIERLWRHVKQEALYSRYYDSFTNFKAAIMECINEIQSGNEKPLSSLFSLKFQIIEKANILNA